MRTCARVIMVAWFLAGIASVSVFGQATYQGPTVKFYPQYQFYILAGPSQEGALPPGLNTTDAAYDLQADESPDCYGLDMDADGFIAKGTIPTGTARVAKTVTLSTTNYYWFYNRLWNMNGTTLTYGANNYEDIFHPDGLSKFVLDEDAQSIIALAPFGKTDLAVVKTTGAYVLSEANDPRGSWHMRPLMFDQALGAADSNCVAVLDGVLYVGNAKGIMAYTGQKTIEVTAKVRNGLTGLTNLVLTCDYAKNRVYGGGVLAYDPGRKKLYKYSGTAFRYTTRQFHLPSWNPIMVDRISMIVQHNDTTTGRISYQVKWEDDAWSAVFTIQAPFMEDKYTLITESLAEARMVRKVQFRITDIVGAKRIKQIMLDGQAFSIDSTGM